MAEILDFVLKALGFLGIGWWLGHEIRSAKDAKIIEDLRKAQKNHLSQIAADSTRRHLDALSDQELVSRVAEGRDPKSGQGPD